MPEDPNSKSSPNPTAEPVSESESQSEAQPVISSYLWGAFTASVWGACTVYSTLMGFSGFRAYVELAMETASLLPKLVHPAVFVCICISIEVNEWFRFLGLTKLAWNSGIYMPGADISIYRGDVWPRTNDGNYTYIWVLLSTISILQYSGLGQIMGWTQTFL